MQRVIYTGRHRAVDLDSGVVAVNGKHTEVPDDQVEPLLARGDFRRAPKPATPKNDPDPEHDDTTGDDAGDQHQEE